jgi:hypothetical protein
MIIPNHGSEFFPSRIRIFSIPDPYQRILTQKSSRKYDPGCSSRILIRDPDFLTIPDPMVKKAPDLGSRIRIRNTGSWNVLSPFPSLTHVYSLPYSTGNILLKDRKKNNQSFFYIVFSFGSPFSRQLVIHREEKLLGRRGALRYETTAKKSGSLQ